MDWKLVELLGTRKRQLLSGKLVLRRLRSTIRKKEATSLKQKSLKDDFQ
jgi:hypothetical protein